MKIKGNYVFGFERTVTSWINVPDDGTLTEDDARTIAIVRYNNYDEDYIEERTGPFENIQVNYIQADQTDIDEGYN